MSDAEKAILCGLECVLDILHLFIFYPDLLLNEELMEALEKHFKSTKKLIQEVKGEE